MRVRSFLAVTPLPAFGMNCPPRMCKRTRCAVLAGILGALFFALPVMRLAAQEGAIGRRPLESSVLAAVGYDVAKRLLEIEFRSGAIYRYHDVPEEIHRRLLAAESKGHFFGAHIRSKFRSELVKPRTAK